jgi:hypothetical protein
MAASIPTTRRAVLAAAGGLPALALATMAGAAVSPPLASLWAEATALATRPGRHMFDAERDRVNDLENAVLHGVITCRADALAKLKAVALSFVRGERTDGSDARALADATAWLEAH